MSENPGLIEALEPVAQAFNKLGVRFYVGGSVASSFHGAARSTMNVDLVADRNAIDVNKFVALIQDDYYVSKESIIDAITRLSCFNLIHLSSAFKVDIFILKSRKFDTASMSRAKPGKIDLKNDFEVPIASPEDTILSKLEWYRLGNEVSERQWEDVVRVMKVLGDGMDREYLTRNAGELKVTDLLVKLIASVVD